eukprot:scaffold596273_cov51-Attheya_sp.AAC.2
MSTRSVMTMDDASTTSFLSSTSAGTNDSLANVKTSAALIDRSRSLVSEILAGPRNGRSSRSASNILGIPIGFEVYDDDVETIRSVEEMRDALIKVQGDHKQTQLKYLAERAEVKYKEKNMIKLAKHLNVMSRVLESKDKDLKKMNKVESKRQTEMVEVRIQLRNEISSSSSKESALEKALKESQEQVVLAETSRDELSERVAQLEADSLSISRALSEREAEGSSFQKQLKQNDSISSQHQTKALEGDKLQAQVGESGKNENKHLAAVAPLTLDNESLLSSKSKKESESVVHENKVKDSNDKARKDEAEIMSKDAKFVKASSRNDERDSKYQSELEKMKISNAELKRELRAKKTDMDKYTAESLRMSKVNNARDSRHQQELDDMQKINEQLKLSLEATAIRAALANKDRDSYKLRSSNHTVPLFEKLKTEEELKDALRSQHMTIRNCRADMETMTKKHNDEIRRLNLKLNERESLIQKLKDEIALLRSMENGHNMQPFSQEISLNTEIASMRIQLDNQKYEMRKLKEERSNILREHRALAPITEEVEQMRKEKVTMTKKLESLRAEARNGCGHHHEISELKKAVREKHRELVKLRAKERSGYSPKNGGSNSSLGAYSPGKPWFPSARSVPSNADFNPNKVFEHLYKAETVSSRYKKTVRPKKEYSDPSGMDISLSFKSQSADSMDL